LGDLPERTAGWRTEEMICAARTTYRLQANWKLHFENFSDTYHVPFVHRSSLNWKTVARRELHDTAIYKGNYIMHYTLFEGTRGVPEGERAFPFLNLPATFRSGTFFPYVYPGTGMGFSIDSMFVSEIYPEAPDVTTYVRNFLIPKAYTELPHYEEILATYLRGLETVTNEDITVLEAQYRALRSPIYTPGRFTAVDRMVHDCENWVLDRVLDDVAA
jgi:phenylpropionate dioxygenase-like ring-hydroxylating dioxygenase large terminal subunit